MNITILGCGWLGKIIGEKFVKDGETVFGSYRDEANEAAINQLGIHPFHLSNSLKPQKVIHYYDNTDVLCIFLPVSKIELIDEFISNLIEFVNLFSPETKIFYTSSIGVYPKKEGIFNEAYSFLDDEKNSNLYHVEEALKGNFTNRLSILRLGGLIGPNRHPINHLAGKKMKDDGSAKINLIHSDDIYEAISRVIQEDKFDSIYNLVYPQIISRKDYYSKYAENVGLSKPIYGTVKALNRLILGAKIEQEVKFNYANTID